MEGVGSLETDLNINTRANKIKLSLLNTLIYDVIIVMGTVLAYWFLFRRTGTAFEASH